jgi:hypothetical protein
MGLETSRFGRGFTAFRINRVASNKPALDTFMIMQRRLCSLVSLRLPADVLQSRLRHCALDWHRTLNEEQSRIHYIADMYQSRYRCIVVRIQWVTSND